MSHIRLSWKKKNWENSSTIQVRVFGNQEKTTISFHQEKLLNGEQRDEMKKYWNEVMNVIANKMN